MMMVTNGRLSHCQVVGDKFRGWGGVSRICHSPQQATCGQLKELPHPTSQPTQTLIGADANVVNSAQSGHLGPKKTPKDLMTTCWTCRVFGDEATSHLCRLGLVDHVGQLGLGSSDLCHLGKPTLRSSQGVCLLGQPKPGQVIYISDFDQVE